MKRNASAVWNGNLKQGKGTFSVGSGAFSYLDGTLYSTSFSLQGYEQRIRRGLSGIVACHRLGEIDRMRYTLLVRMFGLRQVAEPFVLSGTERRQAPIEAARAAGKQPGGKVRRS